MVLFYIIVVLAVSSFEIRSFTKEKQAKELAVFIVLAVITLVACIFYLMDPYGKSLTQHIIYLLGSDD